MERAPAVYCIPVYQVRHVPMSAPDCAPAVPPGISSPARSAAAEASGAQRIDVTLHGETLDHFEQVKQWLDDTNRLMIERGFYNKTKTLALMTALSDSRLRHDGAGERNLISGGSVTDIGK